jgi:ABC-type bacteriocin/lantibiotic exporter with double-glycine peptidase domain
MLWGTLDDDRRFLAPEVVQTSAMDCGPAALKCLLEGFGISVSYGRLREACQTDVDGTSIDTLEDIAGQLGLDAVQMMMPADHLLLPEAQSLPALAVIRLPTGDNHFVVVWGLHGRWVQVMDPGTGRRWLSSRRFLDELAIHHQYIYATDWRDWATSPGFCEPLRYRLDRLELADSTVRRLLDDALAVSGWQALATLDAGTRMVDALVRAGGLMPGEEAESVLLHVCTTDAADAEVAIPPQYWSVQLLPRDESGEEVLVFKGVVLIQAFGRRETGMEEETDQALPPDLAAALEETPSRPLQEILELLKADGLLLPGVLVFALLLGAACVFVEAMLFRDLLELGQSLSFVHRIDAVIALFVFLFGLLLLEFPIHATELRIGRRFETRLRIAVMEKIPRLGDRYFHSRLTSDMVHRVHDLRGLRQLPYLGVGLLQTSFQLVLTTAGIIWISPASTLIVIVALLVTLGLAFASQPVLIERDMNLRTHDAALSRFYLDALLGLIPIRTHTAERVVRREHEGMLVKWIDASLAFYRAETVLQAVAALVGTAFAAWIPFNYIAQGGEVSGVLLLFYWALRLPALGQSLATSLQQYPMQRNRFLRLLELLKAPEEEQGIDLNSPLNTYNKISPSDGGVAIEMRGLGVRAGGHTILQDINLAIAQGEHIAVVGPSGAGKSSLVGILLGWHLPAQGDVLVNGAPLTGQRLSALRSGTAWVDPAVQIWNRSLFDNLHYGVKSAGRKPLSTAIQGANLFDVLERLPDGLQTVLGEGGGLVSGGEGQRVRLGRSIMRPDVRLVLLDEAFRGLDRPQRQALLVKAREHWADATLIFISHDVAETQGFDRVLVMEQGRIVEDAPPAQLLAQASRYRALLEAERSVREDLWANAQWRRLWLENGELQEYSPSDGRPDDKD